MACTKIYRLSFAKYIRNPGFTPLLGVRRPALQGGLQDVGNPDNDVNPVRN